MRFRFWQIVAAFLLGVLGLYEYTTRAVSHPPGVLVPDVPLQGEIKSEVRKVGDYDLTFKASFDIRARVLAHKNYESEPDGNLVPVDLALGWGPMSDSANLDHIDIRQGTRTYGWSFDDARKLPSANIGSIPLSSANMHIIPANDIIRHKLRDVRVGDIVRIQGYLTDYNGPGGVRISSVTRDDKGWGACEIIYAENFTIEARPK